MSEQNEDTLNKLDSLYTNIIDSKWADTLLENADIYISDEYKKYKPYYNFILDYIKQNGFLLSSIELLIRDNVPLDKPLLLFVLDPYKVANELFRLLCKEFNNEFILKVEIQNKNYSIDHIMKTYIKILYIPSFNNVSLIDYIKPIKRNGYILFPAILELIDIYKKIYNPEYCEEWGDLIGIAECIKLQTNKNITNTINEEDDKENNAVKTTDTVATDTVATDSRQNLTTTKKDGGDNDGGDNSEVSTKSDCIECDKKKEDVYNSILKLLYDYISNNSNYILLHKYTENIPLSIISKNAIERDYEHFAKYIYDNGFEKITIIYKQKTLFLGKDMRIKKHTLSAIMTTSKIFIPEKRPLIDIYNNMQYELVPYINITTEIATLKIIHPWAHIRFMFIEVWNVLAAYQLNILSFEKFKKTITILMTKIDNLNIDWKRPPKQYMGIYINEIQSIKQTIIKQGRIMRIFCD